MIAITWVQLLGLSICVGLIVGAITVSYDLLTELLRKRRLERPRVIKDKETDEYWERDPDVGYRAHVVTEEDEWAQEQNK